MMYRLLRLDDDDDYAQIFNEETSELLGSIIKTRRMLFFRQYQLRIEENVILVNRSIFSRRKWTIGDLSIRFSLFGQSVHAKNQHSIISGSGFNRGKFTLNTEEGRTAGIIDPSAFSSETMVMVEDFERIARNELIAIALLILDRYKQW